MKTPGDSGLLPAQHLGSRRAGVFWWAPPSKRQGQAAVCPVGPGLVLLQDPFEETHVGYQAVLQNCHTAKLRF